MFLISKKKNKKGFTLIEIMTVIAIISIISGVTWVNFRHSGRIFDVRGDIARMAQEVRSSLEMTMAMRDHAIRNQSGCAGGIVSYGIRFRTGNTYERMVHVINRNDGTIQCSAVIGEAIVLERGRIHSFEVYPSLPPPPASLDIIFTPPHPRTYIEGVNVIGGRWSSRRNVVEIIVSLDEDPKGGVRVNSAGLIEKIIRPL